MLGYGQFWLDKTVDYTYPIFTLLHLKFELPVTLKIAKHSLHHLQIFAEMPTCLPRDTIVKLPLPEDASVDEVIPSHVVVKRCSGVCHEGNVYHQCVPKSGARTNQGCPDETELDLHPPIFSLLLPSNNDLLHFRCLRSSCVKPTRMA